jgi:hypothetical protein
MWRPAAGTGGTLWFALPLSFNWFVLQKVLEWLAQFSFSALHQSVLWLFLFSLMSEYLSTTFKFSQNSFALLAFSYSQLSSVHLRVCDIVTLLRCYDPPMLRRCYDPPMLRSADVTPMLRSADVTICRCYSSVTFRCYDPVPSLHCTALHCTELVDQFLHCTALQATRYALCYALGRDGKGVVNSMT